MTILPAILDNPILNRELRRRLRGRAMVFSLIAYVGLVCIAAYAPLVLRSQELDPSKGLNFVAQIADTGRSAFYGVLIVQAVLALLVAPSIAAGMIAEERERQTLDFLRVTWIRPATFVFGGLISTMLYVALSQICALPVLCVPFLYGGMSPDELAGWSATLASASLVLCSAGLCLSSASASTRGAMSATMALTMLMLVGVFSALSAMSPAGAGLTAPLWSRYALFGGLIEAPGWALFAAAAVLASAALLLMACRRMYEPERRALNYWQALLVLIAAAAVLMEMWGGDVKSGRLCVWFWAGGGLLCSLAWVLCSGSMVVGDDLWQTKRIAAPLRRVDESVPVLAALSVVWYVASLRFGKSGGMAIDSGTLAAAAMFMAAPALCLGVTLRLVSLAAPGRAWPRRAAPAAAIVLWIVLPALIRAGLYVPQSPGASLKAAAAFSPFYAIPLLAETRARGISSVTLSDWLAMPGSTMATACLVVATLGLPVALRLYWVWSERIRYDEE